VHFLSVVSAAAKAAVLQAAPVQAAAVCRIAAEVPVQAHLAVAHPEALLQVQPAAAHLVALLLVRPVVVRRVALLQVHPAAHANKIGLQKWSPNMIQCLVKIVHTLFYVLCIDALFSPT
jgi:hypothetical protein